MAITLVSTPYPIMAAFNSCYYRMSSTNYNQIGFKYLVRVNIIGTSINYTQNYELIQPGNEAYFDAQSVTNLLTLEKLFPTIFGGLEFKLLPRASVTVEFAESYGGVNYPYNVSHTFQIWGASKTEEQLYQSFPDKAYIWDGVTSNPTTAEILRSQVQNLSDEDVYETTSTFYSVYNYNSGNFKGLRISAFNLESINFRIFCTSSNTVIWSSLEKLKASPFRSGCPASFSASVI